LARIDIEVAAGYEFVDATPPPRYDRYEDQELIDFCVGNVREGIEAELTELFHTLPAIRVVLHRVYPHAVDANEYINHKAGRFVVRQALWGAGVGEAYAVPAFDQRYLVKQPRPQGAS
jgi:hypothetical protein